MKAAYGHDFQYDANVDSKTSNIAYRKMPPLLRLDSTGEISSGGLSPVEKMGQQKVNSGYMRMNRSTNNFLGNFVSRFLPTQDHGASNFLQPTPSHVVPVLDEVFHRSVTEMNGFHSDKGVKYSKTNKMPQLVTKINRYDQWGQNSDNYPWLQPGVFPCHVYSALQSQICAWGAVKSPSNNSHWSGHKKPSSSVSDTVINTSNMKYSAIPCALGAKVKSYSATNLNATESKTSSQSHVSNHKQLKIYGCPSYSSSESMQSKGKLELTTKVKEADLHQFSCPTSDDKEVDLEMAVVTSNSCPPAVTSNFSLPVNNNLDVNPENSNSSCCVSINESVNISHPDKRLSDSDLCPESAGTVYTDSTITKDQDFAESKCKIQDSLKSLDKTVVPIIKSTNAKMSKSKVACKQSCSNVCMGTENGIDVCDKAVTNANSKVCYDKTELKTNKSSSCPEPPLQQSSATCSDIVQSFPGGSTSEGPTMIATCLSESDIWSDSEDETCLSPCADLLDFLDMGFHLGSLADFLPGQNAVASQKCPQVNALWDRHYKTPKAERKPVKVTFRCGAGVDRRYEYEGNDGPEMELTWAQIAADRSREEGSSDED